MLGALCKGDCVVIIIVKLLIMQNKAYVHYDRLVNSFEFKKKKMPSGSVVER